jgi:hypothetical protein
MAQLSDIRTEILETAGLAADDARFPDATMNRIVNRALRQISSEHDWPWNHAQTNLSTVADSQTVTLPAAASKILRLEIAGQQLIQLSATEGGSYSQDRGQPQAYWIEHEKIHFAPVPDGVYTVYALYSAYETALSLDADAPNLPDRYLDWLVQIALVQISQRIRDTDLYQMADRERRMWGRRAADEVRRSGQSMKLKTRSDWWV